MDSKTDVALAKGNGLLSQERLEPKVFQQESRRESLTGTLAYEKEDIEEPKDLERRNTKDSEEVYSEWRPWEKRYIVAMASIAALFSPLSSNIYFPVFNTLASVLHVTNTQINLTVTTYQIFQGVTPMFIAALSDGLGRRPAYVLCFVIYLAANIGLALQTDYVALALLRCLQSAGSSSTVALAKAVVADIAVPQERGLYSMLTSLGIFLGPSFGPVIGGLLAYYLDWRAVFWFLVITSGVFMIPLIIGFPETCRKLVGNGSKRPATWNMSLVSALHLRDNVRRGREPEKASKQPLKVPNVLQTVTIVFEKEMGLITLASGLNFCAFFAVTTSVPSLFEEIYGLNDIQIGLCFIAVGVGSLASSLMQGKLIDWNYSRYARKLGLPIEKRKTQDLSRFPIETARLQIALPLTALAAATTIVYGWLLHFETSLAGPLVILFFNAFSCSAAYSVITVLIIDLYPVKPAAATAGNNLVRCLLSAAATAAIIPMMNRMGRGWACTLVGLVTLATIPTLLACMKHGMRWRAEKAERDAQKKEMKGKDVKVQI